MPRGRKGGSSPDSELVEGVLKDVFPPDIDAQGVVVPLGGAGPHFGPEVGPLVVKVDQPGSAQEGRQVILQQLAVLPDKGIQ